MMHKPEWMTRRSIVTAAWSVAIQMVVFQLAGASAVQAQAPGPGRFTPEAFGAKGDGATDDTAAFQRLAASVKSMVAARSC